MHILKYLNMVKTEMSRETWVRLFTEHYSLASLHLARMLTWYPEIKSACINDLTDWRRGMNQMVGGMP